MLDETGAGAACNLQAADLRIGKRFGGRVAELRNLFDLWSQASGLLGDIDLADLVGLASELMGALRELPDADSTADYFSIAVRILEPVAPLTTNDLDEGLLMALRALGRDAEFMAYLDRKLALADSLPAGALASTADDLPETAERQFVGAATAASWIQWVPVVIELVKQLRDLRRGRPRQPEPLETSLEN
jgi:hypothetical protein